MLSTNVCTSAAAIVPDTASFVALATSKFASAALAADVCKVKLFASTRLI